VAGDPVIVIEVPGNVERPCHWKEREVTDTTKATTLTGLDFGLELLKEVVLDEQAHAVRLAVVVVAERDDEMNESELPAEQGVNLDVAVTLFAVRGLELESRRR
jgi:hypothetical protein